MKTGLLLSCGALALLSLPACGDKPAPTPAPVNSTPAPDLTGVKPAPAPAPVAAPAPQDTAPKPLPRVRLDYETVRRLFGKDPSVDDAPPASSPEKVALGKALYHEKHLSKNGNISCASCHDLANYGVDSKPTSLGADGKDGARNTPTVVNSFRQFRQFWDGRAATVEEQVLQHVLDANVHGLTDEAQLVAKMKEQDTLVAGFKAAFPGDAEPVSVANFKVAIGAFERTLITKSKWDEYLDGNQKALSNDELFGLKTFMDIGCMTCHVGRLVGGHMYQKTGLVKPYASKDEGRMALTKSDADKFFFKVPSLLNVEKTAPYLHDGKVATLEATVRQMADMQLVMDKPISDDQVRGLVAFLKSFTGPMPAEFGSGK